MPVDGVSVKTGFYFLLNGINLVMVEVNTLETALLYLNSALSVLWQSRYLTSV